MKDSENSNDKPNPPKPEGRFNDWGERKWITVSEEKQEAVDKELLQLELSHRARDLFMAARFTNSTGIEFAFISNAQFPAVFPESGLHIVPCFTPLNPAKPESEKRQAAMMKWGQFIYDGWLPNDEWTDTKFEQIESLLDDTVSLFSLVGGYYAYWEPKYLFSKGPVPSHLASQSEFQSLAQTLYIMDSLLQADRNALSRSLAWISNALRNAPVQRFLLLFVSIEALVTHIERESAKDSPLRVLFAGDRLTKAEREICIEETLKSGLGLTEAIQESYFKCVIGNKAMLEKHLKRVFGDDRASEVMFGKKAGGKTLWDLRNDLAHGNLNVLSETEVRSLTSRVGALEDIARSYLRVIFSKLAKTDYFAKTRRPLLTIPASQILGSPGTEYAGPTDMAEYYANVEALSASYLRVRL